MRGIKIVCVGKVKESFFREGIEDAAAGIRRSFPVAIRECKDEPTKEGASPAEESIILKKEGQRILSCIDREDYVVALSIDGKRYDSASFKRHLKEVIRKIKEQGSLVFVIGGSLGLSPEVLRRADEKLSFSAMTFPHQLMRMVLMEELCKNI